MGFLAKSANPSIVDSPQALADMLGLSYESVTGVNVSPETAMRFTTVFSCVRVIAESIGLMPVTLKRRVGDTRIDVPNHPLDRILRVAPNDFMTAAGTRPAPADQHRREEQLPRIEPQALARECALDVKERRLYVVDAVPSVGRAEHQPARRPVDQILVMPQHREKHEFADNDLAAQHRQAVIEIPPLQLARRQTCKALGWDCACPVS